MTPPWAPTAKCTSARLLARVEGTTRFYHRSIKTLNLIPGAVAVQKAGRRGTC